MEVAARDCETEVIQGIRWPYLTRTEDAVAKGATKEATEPTLSLKQPTHEQEQRTRN